VADNNDPLSILRNAEVNRIEQTNFNCVIEALERINDFIQIPVVPIEETSHILEQPKLRI